MFSFVDCVLAMFASGGLALLALGEWRGLRGHGDRAEVVMWFSLGAVAVVVGITCLIAIYAYIQHWIGALLSWRLY